jgi:type IX secretion system PorP/SprF family membrane protein
MFGKRLTKWKKNAVKSAVVAVGCIAFSPVGAQDVHFSQFRYTPQLINPASTGVYEGFERLILNYRNQWSSIGAPFTTMAASFDMPIFNDPKKQHTHLGLGLNVFSDKAGDAKFGTTQVNLSLSAIMPLSETSTLSAGLTFGGAQRSAKLEELRWGNQFDGTGFDPTIPHNEINSLNSYWYGDVGLGVMYQFSNVKDNFQDHDVYQFTVGGGYFHVNKPVLQYISSSSESLAPKIVAHASGRIDIPESVIGFMPIAVHMMQGPHTETNVGMMVRYRMKTGTKFTGFNTESAFSFGAQYRVGDSWIPQIILEVSNYVIGFSYDLNNSNLKDVSKMNGGFEITFQYRNLQTALFQTKSLRKIFKTGGGKGY